MTDLLQKLRQNHLLRLFLTLFESKSDKLDEAFRERAIRYFVIVAVIFFSITYWLDHSTLLISQVLWYGTIYGICGLVFLALHFGRVDIAARIMIFSLLLILLDVSKAYWSPGTIIFSLLFTFMFQMILSERREIFFAVSLNLAIYTYIALSSSSPSPLARNDFFAQPHLALLTTYVAQLFIIGIAHYIRQEQRERNQAELMFEKERVTILREFIDHASHDLRTPITKLKTQLYLLGKKYPENSPHELQTMQASLAELDLMVSGMLEILRLDDTSAFVLESLDLDSMIQDVLAMYQDEISSKALRLDYAPNSPSLQVAAEDVYLRRALGNILENALTYTPEKGQISIRSWAEKQAITIEIRDTGIGIAAANLPKIFQPFYRADAARSQSTGRNGLGLAISQKIIELHHGSIEVESVLNAGTTFRIVLPRIQ